MSKQEMQREQTESFYSGVICALLVVVGCFDQETIAFEILKGCDVQMIRRIAEREGDKAIVALVKSYQRHRRETECTNS